MDPNQGGFSIPPLPEPSTDNYDTRLVQSRMYTARKSRAAKPSEKWHHQMENERRDEKINPPSDPERSSSDAYDSEYSRHS